MDLTDTLKNEVFRPLTTIVIPGVISICPYIFVVTHHYPKTIVFIKDYNIPFFAALFIFTIALGLIFENIGSDIEELLDCILNKKQKERKENWIKYLRLKINDEYIGQRYLRTIHIRFKFELSMIPAMIFFLFGIIWSNHLYAFITGQPYFWVITSILLIIIYLAYQAYTSANVLGSCHKSLLKAVSLEQKEEKTVPPTAPNPSLNSGPTDTA